MVIVIIGNKLFGIFFGDIFGKRKKNLLANLIIIERRKIVIY